MTSQNVTSQNVMRLLVISLLAAGIALMIPAPGAARPAGAAGVGTDTLDPVPARDGAPVGHPGEHAFQEQQQPDGLPILKSAVMVEDTVIRLGDLFINPGPHADRAIAHAPSPGRQATFDARWLARVAANFGLRWRPVSTRQSIVVERLSQVISREEIEDTILAALIDEGANPDMIVVLNNRFSKLHVPGNIAAAVGVEDIHYDPRSQRFAAVIAAPEGAPDAQRLRVSGQLHQVKAVPMLTRAIPRGEMIRESDVKLVDMRSDYMQADVMTDLGDLIGMEPKRGLRPNLPIRASEVQRPVLVEKNGTVTMVVSHGALQLSMQGRALSAGAEGDIIEIMNPQTRKVIEAEVTGKGRARVRLTTARQLAENN